MMERAANTGCVQKPQHNGHRVPYRLSGARRVHHHTGAQATLIAPVSQHLSTHEAGDSLLRLMHVSSDFIQALTLSSPPPFHHTPIKEVSTLHSSSAYAMLASLLEGSSATEGVAEAKPASQLLPASGSTHLDSQDEKQRSYGQHASQARNEAAPACSTLQPRRQDCRDLQAVQLLPTPLGHEAEPCSAAARPVPLGVDAPVVPSQQAHLAGWQWPSLLSAHQLVTCVCALAKAGHVPSSAWMHDCLAASERVFLQQTGVADQPMPVHDSRFQPSIISQLQPERTATFRQCAVSPNQCHAGTGSGSIGRLQPARAAATWAPASQNMHHNHQPSTGQLDEEQLFLLTWGVARLYQLQREQLSQPPVAAPAGAGTSRLGNVLSQLSEAPSSRSAASSEPWQRPPLSWLHALERASLAVASLSYPQPQNSNPRSTSSTSLSDNAAAASTGTATLTKPAPSITRPPVQQASGDSTPERRGHLNGTGQRPHKRIRTSPCLFAVVPWCMAMLGMCPSRAWLEVWTAAMRPTMRAMGGQDVAQIAWALARLAYRPPVAWMQELVARVEQLAVERQLVPQDLGMLMWACATMQFDCGSHFVVEALSPHVLATSPLLASRFSARDVAHIMWALARLQQRPPVPVLHNLLAMAAPHVRRMNEKDLTQTVWALARMRYDPTSAMRRKLVHAVGWCVVRRSFTPRGLPTLLWSLARLPWRLPSTLTARLLDVAAAMAKHLSPLGVAMVFYFAAKQPRKMHHRHVTALLKATLVRTEHRGLTPAGSQAKDLQGGSKAGPAAGDGADRAVRGSGEAPAEARSVWSGCSCRTAAMALRALASCHVRPHRAWMHQYLAGTMQTLPTASAVDLCTLTSALSALCYSPPAAWTHTFAQRAQQLRAQGQLLPAQEARLAPFAGFEG